jgi:L-alanine-DL-glutamate epimerase-like enolase superfamily enzyme
MPLAFGSERVNGVTCLRVALDAENGLGKSARGWGEVPLNVQWMWPSQEISYEQRLQGAYFLAANIASRLPETLRAAHPLEISSAFMEGELPALSAETARRVGTDAVPVGFARGIYSAFDLALHDVFGLVNEIPVYKAYSGDFLRRDLRYFLDEDPVFTDVYPDAFLRPAALNTLEVWHLVGWEDPLDTSDLTGEEPADGYPVVLRDWIRQDGLRHLKIKLCGQDANADIRRLVKTGKIALEEDVSALAVDFNCTVREPSYLRELLGHLRREEPEIFDMLRFVEQPFAADLQTAGFDVRSLSSIKSLILDESAFDWKSVRLGASLGWSGAALKTCKTQTAMIIAYSWLCRHGLEVMVHDLTNPMLAQLAHLQLAANLRTSAGVESNSMQYYPGASLPEQRIHSGAYRRQRGTVDISTLRGSGFGYRIEEIERRLPEPELVI